MGLANTFKNNTEPKQNTIPRKPRPAIKSTVYPDDYGFGYNYWVHLMQPVFDGLHKTPREYELLDKQINLQRI